MRIESSLYFDFIQIDGSPAGTAPYALLAFRFVLFEIDAVPTARQKADL